MAAYKKLTKSQEARYVGQTADLLRKGLSNSEIADKLKQPLTRVNGWVELCKTYGNVK